MIITQLLNYSNLLSLYALCLDLGILLDIFLACNILIINVIL